MKDPQTLKDMDTVTGNRVYDMFLSKFAMVALCVGVFLLYIPGIVMTLSPKTEKFGNILVLIYIIPVFVWAVITLGIITVGLIKDKF